MRRRLPQAEIVAVDFSTPSIALARRLQRVGKFGKPIDFSVADLTDPDLAAKTGGAFDLITCHGVLSYIPDPGRALQSFAACLRDGGALYLGVNGEAHPATRLRPWLVRFGLAVDELCEERRLRELLRLWDSLHDDGYTGLAGMPPSYLASDICGPHFNNWPLDRWRTEANRSGWEIASTAILPLALRLTMDGDALHPLFPAGVGELAGRMDLARPASFHQMLLRRAAPGSLDIGQGSGWESRLRWTGFYNVRLTKAAAGDGKLAILSCATLHLRLACPLTALQAAALPALVEAGTAPAGWLRQWGRSEAARRILWLWAGLGVMAVGDT